MSKICKTCDNDKFEYNDGFYYCTVCGSKTHDVQDIQLSDDELFGTGGKRIQSIKPVIKHLKKEQEDLNENVIDLKFSTYEVINYVLRRQVKDLIRIGCDPIIKKYVLEIWMRYLNILGVAFHTTEEAVVNESNIKWARDKEYFEAHKLKEEYEENKMDEEDEIKIEPYDFSEQETQHNISGYDDQDDNDNEENENEEDDIEIKHELMDKSFNQKLELNEDEDIPKKKKSRERIVLTSFEYVRLPYTIIILNLALIIIKSPILITDLVRFIRSGIVSYFNIDEILPKSMKFKYGEDTIMFNAKALPKTDLLRYLTIKFAKFLNFNIIRSIDLRKITARFIIDLNLPLEINYFVNSLMKKLEEPLINDFNILAGQTINLEASALAYILCVVIIVCQFEPYDYNPNTFNKFSLYEWFNEMQNVLSNMDKQIFGCNLGDIETIEDIQTLNYHLFKHRFISDAKAYISNYHKQDIIDSLGLPLGKTDRLQQTKNIQNSSLFYITNENSTNFRQKTVQHLINCYKIEILVTKKYRCSKFKTFIKENCQNKELRGRFELGLETNTFNWLVECFQYLSQASDHYSMYSYFDKLMFKIVKYS